MGGKLVYIYQIVIFVYGGYISISQLKLNKI